MGDIGRFNAAVQAVEEAAQQHLGSWVPADGEEFDAMLAALPGMWGTFQTIFNNMAQVLHEHASEHPVVHEMEEAASSFQGMEDAFQAVYDRHRIEHEREMQRYENPRPGEPTWNVPG